MFYSTEDMTDGATCVGSLTFQDGPIAQYGINGTTNEEVLEAILERLNALNQPPYACRENAIAITHIETGLLWLKRRTENRLARKVEGTSTP